MSLGTTLSVMGLANGAWVAAAYAAAPAPVGPLAVVVACSFVFFPVAWLLRDPRRSR
jgi:hypothetical protein